MMDADLTDLVKNIDFDTEPGVWDKDTNKDFMDETDNLGPQRNAPRNVKLSGDDLSEARSTNQEESLEDSMDTMDFMVDKYQNSNKVESNHKKDKVTIQTSHPAFSMATAKCENTLSTLALTTTFDDDVKKYQVFETPEDDAEFQNMCRRPIGAGNTVCINARCRIMAHEGVRRANIPQGQLYIQRNKSSVFAMGRINC